MADLSEGSAPRVRVPGGPVCKAMGVRSDPIMAGGAESLLMSEDLVD